MPPFAPPGPSDWFPDFLAPTAALRLLRAPWSLGFSLRFQVPVLSGDVLICPQSLYQSIRESRLSHTTGRIPLGIPA